MKKHLFIASMLLGLGLFSCSDPAEAETTVSDEKMEELDQAQQVQSEAEQLNNELDQFIDSL